MSTHPRFTAIEEAYLRDLYLAHVQGKDLHGFHVDRQPPRVQKVVSILLDCNTVGHREDHAFAQKIRDLAEVYIAPPAKAMPQPRKPLIDEIHLVGTVDRTLSEMKYILDHPGEFDEATFQTLKHHIEDIALFVKYAEGKLKEMKKVPSLPPVAEQRERGY